MAENPQGPWTLDAPARGAGRAQLWCFAYAGGGASAFHGWGEALAPLAETRAVQMPGRENRLREPPFETWPDLLDGLAAALGPRLEEPWALYGHSLGGLIAFEFARRMAFEGYPPPAAFFVGGCRPPEHPRRRDRPLHALPDADFIAELKRLGGTPDAVFDSAELRAIVLPALRADFKLLDGYRDAGGPPLDCPVFAFAGAGDAEAPAAELVGWARRTTGAFRTREFPGGHFFLRPARAEVLAALRGALGELP